MEKNNTKPASEKHRAKGFANWSLTSKDGTKKVRSGKGFVLQGHPDYPNRQEDFLLKLAEESEDGIYRCTMEVEIHLNTPKEELETSLF